MPCALRRDQAWTAVLLDEHYQQFTHSSAQDLAESSCEEVAAAHIENRQRRVEAAVAHRLNRSRLLISQAGKRTLEGHAMDLWLLLTFTVVISQCLLTTMGSVPRLHPLRARPAPYEFLERIRCLSGPLSGKHSALLLLSTLIRTRLSYLKLQGAPWTRSGLTGRCARTQSRFESS